MEKVGDNTRTSGPAFPGAFVAGLEPYAVRALKVVSSADCCVSSSRKEARYKKLQLAPIWLY